jgi:hypothetical protein
MFTNLTSNCYYYNDLYYFESAATMHEPSFLENVVFLLLFIDIFFMNTYNVV